MVANNDSWGGKEMRIERKEELIEFFQKAKESGETFNVSALTAKGQTVVWQCAVNSLALPGDCVSAGTSRSAGGSRKNPGLGFVRLERLGVPQFLRHRTLNIENILWVA